MPQKMARQFIDSWGFRVGLKMYFKSSFVPQFGRRFETGIKEFQDCYAKKND